MPYRRTKKYSAERLAAMRAGKDRACMERPAPDYPPDLPDLRMRITITRYDYGEETHVFELRKSRRVDQFRVTVDGKPLRGQIGLTRILDMLRKATPRAISPRAAS
jgi:hypothetical protein